MENYRSPPPPSFTPIAISGPRSLRPREQQTPAFSPIAFPTPVYTNNSLPSAGMPPVAEERYAPNSLGVDLEGGLAAENLESPTNETTRVRGRGLVGGLVSGLRKIPRVMHKHHSRESMYMQYEEEMQKEAMRASMAESQYGQHTSMVLSNIPENSEAGSVMPPIPEGYSVNGTPLVPRPWLPHHTPINSPEYFASPSLQSTDLDHSESSTVEPLPPQDTWGYYVRRVQIFFDEVKKLPWTSSKVAQDYVPSKMGRGQYSSTKPAISWYAPKSRKTDLVADEKYPASSILPPAVLVMPSTPGSNGFLPQVMPASPFMIGPAQSVHSEGGATAVRGMFSPQTVTSAGAYMQSPGASSHGMGRHSLSYSWYYGPSQSQTPYTQPSGVSSPQTRYGSEGSYASP